MLSSVQQLNQQSSAPPSSNLSHPSDGMARVWILRVWEIWTGKDAVLFKSIWFLSAGQWIASIQIVRDISKKGTFCRTDSIYLKEFTHCWGLLFNGEELLFWSLQYISELGGKKITTRPCYTEVAPPGFLPVMHKVIHGSETKLWAKTA